MRQEHIDQIKTAVAAVAAKKNLNHFYFVACGGSQAFMMPAQYIFDRLQFRPAFIHLTNSYIERRRHLVLIQL